MLPSEQLRDDQPAQPSRALMAVPAGVVSSRATVGVAGAGVVGVVGPEGSVKPLKLPAAPAASPVPLIAPVAVSPITLKALRKSRKITQKDMAQRMGITQANVSRLESRSDMLVSTLLDFVNAAEGEVEILVRIRHDVFSLKLDKPSEIKPSDKSS